MATVTHWTVEDVAAWIEQCLRLPYARKFVEAGIDGVQLVHLTQDGLLKMGVDSEEHVKCLLDHAAVLRFQFERSLRAGSVAEADQKMEATATQTDWSAPSCRRSLTGMMYPRVGSPILCAGKVHNRHEHVQLDTAEPRPDVQEVQAKAGADPTNKAGRGGKEDAQAAGFRGVSSQSSAISAAISTTCSSVAGSGYVEGPGACEAVKGQPHLSIPLPSHRPPSALSSARAVSARCGSEAMSRCSSAPSSRKRGPAVAAADGASLFLSDQSKGAFFGTTSRDIEILPDSLGPGPACYESGSAALKTSSRVSLGIPKFSSEPRRTMECMFMRGTVGPGSGKPLGQ
ncbi:unnamed protein product [Effrenium voratum]|uniref:SAM domain-containing protein n=2 Tax=Effrenium voratum TaxID=2562239 RepID=A0AA36IGI6_9DINO|nr:unnamed protein product [Effrenium voratum]